MNVSLKKLWLSVEFILLFFGIPIYIFFDPQLMHPSSLVLPIIIAIFIYFIHLPDFSFKELVKFRINKIEILKHILLAVFVSLILLLIVYLFKRDSLFNLLRANPIIMLIFWVLYPVFSAYGQEIIYRTFLFRRYRKLFKTDLMIILASSVAFSFVHIIYYSHVSIILTFILGLYLALTYLRTKCVLWVGILHGLYGNLVFTIGLGNYFWLDIYRWL